MSSSLAEAEAERQTWRQAMEELEADEEPCMGSGYSPSPIVEGTTLESLTAKHARATWLHRASMIYAKTSKMFRETVLTEKSLRVSSCICLCLGSLSGPPEEEDDDPENTIILSQLVAFEGIIELLKTNFDIGAVYFQDPVFNWLDKAFLESKGYTVLSSPDALNFMTTETFLFTPHCPQGCLPACLERAFPSMALGLTITKQNHWFYDSQSDPSDKHKQNRLPARYQSRGLYESFLRTRRSIDVPLTKVPIPRRRRARSDKRIKSRAPGYVPAPRIPLYFVTDAWRDLPPVDSRFQVPKDHLLNRQQANVVMRFNEMLPWNATQEDTDVWDVLTSIDCVFGKRIQAHIGQYLPNGLRYTPCAIFETVPPVFKDKDAMSIYAEKFNAVVDTHLSDFDKGSSDEEDSSAEPASSSSSAKSSSFWESDTDPDSVSEMDLSW